MRGHDRSSFGFNDRVRTHRAGVQRCSGVTSNDESIQAADRFQLLVDAVEEYAIFMLEADGVVASWNSGAQRIKGYSAEEIIGRHFSAFYTSDDIANGKPVRALLEATERGYYREEGWRIRKDGKTFWANVLITAIRAPDGEVTGFAKVTRDDTERRSAELAARTAMLEAERANAAKDQFLSRMSHELRTPLNAILGFGQLLAADDPAGERSEDVAHILAAATHLLGLIDEVLDISRMESGAMRLSMEAVDIKSVAEEAVGMLRPLADHRHIAIVNRLDDASLIVRADRQRLKQVIVNLLANAIKFNADGGELHLDGERRHDGLMRVSITDTGPGISEADMSRLFLPFERLSRDRDQVEGTGLGLALCKHLMTAMAGEIGGVSRLGVGSTFWIELPVTTEQLASPEPAVDSNTATSPRRTAHRTVLYVEDNASNVRLVERILTRRPDVTLIVATHGRLAVDLAFEHRPDLILLDLHLPDISGEDVLTLLRADPRTTDTAVVIISADATPGNPSWFLTAGADDYLTKPFDIARLLEIIDTTRNRTGWDGLSTSPAVTPTSSALARTPELSADATAALIPEFVHDFNNLLGTILNYCTVLAHEVTDGRASSDIATIRETAERAVELTRSLHDRTHRRQT